MSIRIMNQVWDSKKVKATEKLALLSLADHANDDGWAYPSYGKLALRTGVTKRQAMNIIDSLVAIGAVWVVPNPGHRNGYIVMIDQKRDEIVRRLAECEKIGKDKIEEIANLIEKRQRGETGFTGEMDFTSGGEMDFTPGVKLASPKPLKNHQIETSISNEVEKPKRSRPQDLLFNAIRDHMEVAQGQVSIIKQQMLGRFPKNHAHYQSNFDPPATPQEVEGFVQWWRNNYPDGKLPLSPPKLQNHFYKYREIGKPKTRTNKHGLTETWLGNQWQLVFGE